VANIRNMVGKTDSLNSLAKHIWEWCISRDIWLSATHVPGTENEADFDSRHFNDNVEWKLNEPVFRQIEMLYGKLEVDMFASRLNAQLECFVSWKPDPDAEAIDAFSVNWADRLIYAFPPFSLIGRLLQKTRQDKAEVVLVAPLWVTQNWFTAVLEMLVDMPRFFKVGQKTLKIPHTNKVHPLVNKLHLMVCHISGDLMQTDNFQRNLLRSSWHRGDAPPRSNMPRILTDGFSSVVKGKQISFIPL